MLPLHMTSQLWGRGLSYGGALNPFLDQTKRRGWDWHSFYLILVFYLIKGLGIFIINKVWGIKMNTPLLNACFGYAYSILKDRQ